MLSHPPHDIAIGILIVHANIVLNADIDISPMTMKKMTDLEEINPLPKSLFNNDMKMETLKLISLVNHQKSSIIMFFTPKEHLSQGNLFLLNLSNQKLHLHLQNLNLSLLNHAKKMLESLLLQYNYYLKSV